MSTHNSQQDIFGDLFHDLHMSGIWSDGKLITDAIPKNKPDEIVQQYKDKKDQVNFDLEAFFNLHFSFQKTTGTNFSTDTSMDVTQHIERLWDVLYREPDQRIEGSSLIPLDKPYIVPGGRFNEIYYWDSYFTMLGLQISGRLDVIESMLDNFASQIHTYGFIPNGNRTYFLSRSQPPFFSLMIELLAESKGPSILLKYQSALEKEYEFWMAKNEVDISESNSSNHVIKMDNGQYLNRYFDREDLPRAEMYGADMELLHSSKDVSTGLFQSLRSACESGWDFSSRWLKDSHDLGSIESLDIISIDLNCLLWSLENTLSKIYKLSQNDDLQLRFSHKASQRKKAIHQYFWNDKESYFFDYHKLHQSNKIHWNLAGVFPLFVGIATKQQAEHCAHHIESKFFKSGGLVTTTIESGQQWDAPNGWAPLQWIVIKGLMNYGYVELANNIKNAWVNLNTKVFKSSGKLLEKYNVVNIDLETGGGEYPVQDGFGWTNGVLLKLIHTKIE